MLIRTEASIIVKSNYHSFQFENASRGVSVTEQRNRRLTLKPINTRIVFITIRSGRLIGFTDIEQLSRNRPLPSLRCILSSFSCAVTTYENIALRSRAQMKWLSKSP